MALEESRSEEIEEALNVIEDGGLVIFPTETAYGIAADATNPKAIDKVYEAKQRPRSKGLTVIVSSLSQAETYAELSEKEFRLAEEFMPGPLTLITDKRDIVPDSLNDDFAFRIPGSKMARELAEEIPITATSANLSGQKTSYKVEDISKELKEEVDLILDSGRLEESPTSTIAEVDDACLTVHREGPIKKQELSKLV